MPYRQIEGFIGKISNYEPGLLAADYTTLFRRISKLALQITVPEMMLSLQLIRPA